MQKIAVNKTHLSLPNASNQREALTMQQILSGHALKAPDDHQLD